MSRNVKMIVVKPEWPYSLDGVTVKRALKGEEVLVPEQLAADGQGTGHLLPPGEAALALGLKPVKADKAEKVEDKAEKKDDVEDKGGKK